MSLLDEKPPMINTEICKTYSNPDEGTCSENCPFHAECTPWFEALARELEEIYKEHGNAWPNNQTT